MANYTGEGRSNNFKVLGTGDDFKKALEDYNNLECRITHDKDGQAWARLLVDDMDGNGTFCTEKIDPETDEPEPNGETLEQCIQRHLTDDSVALLYHVGHAKLRYLGAHVTVVSKTQIMIGDLRTFVDGMLLYLKIDPSTVNKDGLA